MAPRTFLSTLVGITSNSQAFAGIRSILSKYNVHWNMLYDVKCMCDTISQYYFTTSYTELDYLYAENIKTLLFHRDSIIKSGVGCMLTNEELHIMLDYFCTGVSNTICVLSCIYLI